MLPAQIKAFDTDNDQAWNVEEYSANIGSLSPEAWRRLFDILDMDETGYLSKSEAEMSWSKRVIDSMDDDGNGQIDFGELEAYLSNFRYWNSTWMAIIDSTLKFLTQTSCDDVKFVPINR